MPYAGGESDTDTHDINLSCTAMSRLPRPFFEGASCCTVFHLISMFMLKIIILKIIIKINNELFLL